MKITVTEEHIRRGRRRACSACPLALAISEAVGMRMEVGVLSTWCDPAKLITLPEEAQEFIDRFDRGRKVHPFSFELPISPDNPPAPQ